MQTKGSGKVGLTDNNV